MKINTIKNILLVVSLLFTSTIYSQTKITGTVTDDNGLPLPGVNIVVKGTQKGTVSDFNGNYSIETSPSGILEYSYVGYLTQDINIGGKTTINVTMQVSFDALDEVVVVGYGTQKRADVTGAVTSISTDVLESRPITNIEEALQGQATGLSISSTGGQPGAATKINIRGISSVSGSSQPLFVVDGFPISEVATSGGGRLEEFNSQMSPFAYINPDDIASIEVLKDASATAIYGNRGANGVIIITTKKGKTGQSRVTYNGFYGISTPIDEYEVFNGEEFADYVQIANTNP